MVNLLEHNGIQEFLYDNNLEVHFDVVRDKEKLLCMWRCWFYYSKLMRPHLMYDDGAAYDRGVHRAALQKKCPGDCTIIEVIEARA